MGSGHAASSGRIRRATVILKEREGTEGQKEQQGYLEIDMMMRSDSDPRPHPAGRPVAAALRLPPAAAARLCLSTPNKSN